MKKDSIIDYLSYSAFRLLGPAIRALPVNTSLFLGRVMGMAIYYLDCKHRAKAYSNLKSALGNDLPPEKLYPIIKDFYRNFGQNLIEVFFLPKVNKAYLDKYVKLEGKENIEKAFEAGKGVILLGMHAGSWELSNLVCANLGFPFNLFVRQQRLPRLDSLLNEYRKQKGCKILQRQNQTRSLIEALRNNESIGMTADQGGKNGELVRFFGKEASMPTGAVKLALKYGSVILPAYYTRVRGPYQKIIIEAPFQLKITGNEPEDTRLNLQRLMPVFENLIRQYPDEYYWPYKIWKYSSERSILILSDNKAGHLKQSQAIAELLKSILAEKGIRANIDLKEVSFKSRLSRDILVLRTFLSGRSLCPGRIRYLKPVLKENDYKSLQKVRPDFIISAGSSLAALNFILSRENAARSVVLMRPSILSTRNFDLVLMPRHDLPPKRRNVVVTDGALSLADEHYFSSAAEEFIKHFGLRITAGSFNLGFLIGGSTKSFSLREEDVREAVRSMVGFSEKNSSVMLASTSRRTSPAVEALLKKELSGSGCCKALIIANENNPPYAVSGILALSKVVVVSPESISMISEAVNSGKYVVVFKSSPLDKKHERFLDNFARKGYIYLVRPDEVGAAIERIKRNNPLVNTLNDNSVVVEALKKII